jgi:hypothetical protein
VPFVVSTDVPSYSDFEPNRVKHMEMIQAVVARLAGNSFLIKGWALTLTVALLGFAVNTNSSGLAAVAILPIIVFWRLDAYYLHTEWLFRELHKKVRTCAGDLEPFFMGATDRNFVKTLPANARSRWTTLWRPALWPFYASLFLATAAVIVGLCWN